MKKVLPKVSSYFAGIGRKGGAKSRRLLSSETARDLVRGAWPTVNPYPADGATVFLEN